MNETLTIVIPAFNESKRILKTLNEIDEYIFKKSLKNFLRVIVVNDGSLDDTELTVKNWIQLKGKNKELFQVLGYTPNYGKGYAVREGFLRASTDLVLYTDADGAAPIIEAEKLLAAIKDGYDVAIGSRVIKTSNSEVTMSVFRRFIGRIFHMILSILGLAEFKDTQCGFKLFRSAIAKELVQNQKCFGFSFDIEYLFLLKRMGYKIKEVPISWYHVGGSKVNIFKDSIRMLLEVLKIRFVYKYNVTDLKTRGQ